MEEPSEGVCGGTLEEPENSSVTRNKVKRKRRKKLNISSTNEVPVGAVAAISSSSHSSTNSTATSACSDEVKLSSNPSVESNVVAKLPSPSYQSILELIKDHSLLLSEDNWETMSQVDLVHHSWKYLNYTKVIIIQALRILRDRSPTEVSEKCWFRLLHKEISSPNVDVKDFPQPSRKVELFEKFKLLTESKMKALDDIEEKRMLNSLQLEFVKKCCIKCRKEKAQFVALPCGHFLHCQSCSAFTNVCPRCGQHVSRSCKVFYS